MSVRWAAKSSNSLEVLLYVQEGYRVSTKVILKKVRVMSQKVTIEKKSQTCRVIHVFGVISNVDIDIDGYLTL